MPIGRLRLFVEGDYRNTRRRPTFEIDVRSRRTENGVSGGMELELASRWSLELKGERRHFRFDADAIFERTRLAEVLNRQVGAVTAAVRWRRTALSTFMLEADVRETRFALARDRDSLQTTVSARGEFHPRALVAGSWRIGARLFDGYRAALPDFSGVVALADLSYRLRATTLTVTAQRDVLYSFLRFNPYYVLERYGVRAARRLGDRFDVDGGLDRETYDYQSLRTGAAAQRAGGREDARWILSASFGYRLSDTMRAGFRTTWFNRDSSHPVGRQYGGLGAGLEFSYGP